MAFNYCPECGMKLMGRVSVGTGSGILCESCFYGKRSPDRLKALREKYRTDGPLSRVGSALLLDGRHLRTAATMIDELAGGAVAVIIELLDMLEAKQLQIDGMYEAMQSWKDLTFPLSVDEYPTEGETTAWDIHTADGVWICRCPDYETARMLDRILEGVRE